MMHARVDRVPAECFFKKKVKIKNVGSSPLQTRPKKLLYIYLHTRISHQDVHTRISLLVLVLYKVQIYTYVN